MHTGFYELDLNVIALRSYYSNLILCYEWTMI